MAPPTEAHDDDSLADELEPGRAASKHIGTLVAGTYRITRHIGSGGSSHVFEAEHVRLGKTFALKLLRPELHTGRLATQRFRREARAIARLQNEHIVSVVDYGELDDQIPYLVMELLPGQDLRALLKREGSLPARRAVRLVLDACQGLNAVHAAGLVHRDLKPENLFITQRTTGEDWCKVLDFGVAKMEASMSTAQGAIVGTVRYMAPEQLTDGSLVTPATDIYALGAILYECLTGRAPYAGATVQELMYKIMNHEAPALARERPELPAGLSEVVKDCLSRRVSERPVSAIALADQLRESLRNSARPSSLDTLLEEAPSPPRAVPRTTWQPAGVPFWLGAVSLGVGIGLALSSTSSSGRATDTTQAPAAPSHTPARVAPAPSVSVSSNTPKEQPRPEIPAGVAPLAPSTVLKHSPSIATQRLMQPPKQEGPDVVPTPPHRVTVGAFDPANPYGE